MSKLLFELGCEEIPARFMNNLLKDLSTNVQDRLKKNRLSTDGLLVKTIGTYRRLTLVIDGVLSKQTTQAPKTILGPPQKAAQDSDGNWTAAALGWAKKNQIDPTKIQFKEDQKGRLCCSVILEGSRAKSAQELLPQILEAATKAIKLPIAMRWGTETIPFVRTIQWICCILDTEIIPVSLYDVVASNQSQGHRFLSETNHSDGDLILIPHVDDYEATLEKKPYCRGSK